ncbi:hypothetical protein DITRI_Ditri01bG0015200 [Diplodiscus trichospermus]
MTRKVYVKCIHRSKTDDANSVTQYAAQKNDIVFRGKHLDLCKLEDLIKLRLANWVKIEWPNLQKGITDFIRNPSNNSFDFISGPTRIGTIWLKPPAGSAKFNVDGSALGKPGPAGIGGVLRDHQGDELIRFSKSIGIADSNEAVVHVYREGNMIADSLAKEGVHRTVLCPVGFGYCIIWKLSYYESNDFGRGCNVADWMFMTSTCDHQLFG